MARAARPWTDTDIRENAVPGRAYSKFGQPGLMLRCGARKRSWQVRFEVKHGYLQRQLGEWPKGRHCEHLADFQRAANQ